MNEEIKKKLNQINIDFYKQVSKDFDKTRQYSWQGWQIISDTITQSFKGPITVLDIGCGNGRFAKFLIDKNHNVENYLGIDQDKSLLNFGEESLSSDTFKMLPSNLLDIDFKTEYTQKFNLITLFGVMHHVPSHKTREQLIVDLYHILKPGGLLAISFWDFMGLDRFKNKVTPWNNIGINTDQVEKNDYLLTWERGTKSIRYCHYTDSDELQALIKKVNADDVMQFSADGKTGSLNKYLVFRKN